MALHINISSIFDGWLRYNPDSATPPPVLVRPRQGQTRTKRTEEDGTVVLPVSGVRVRYLDNGDMEVVGNVRLSDGLTDADKRTIETHTSPKLKMSRYLAIKRGLANGQSQQDIIRSLTGENRCSDRTFETYRAAIYKSAGGGV